MIPDDMSFLDIIKVMIPVFFLIGDWIASAPLQDFTQPL